MNEDKQTTVDGLAAERVDLLRKRWAGTITSEEQDHLDELTDALRVYAAAWNDRHRRLLLASLEGVEA